jgi:hypothetical protein
MNNHIRYHQIIECLEEHHLAYGVLPLHNGVRLIISAYGGRIFGPFLPPESSSIYWTSDVFSTPDAFDALVKAQAARLGGERLWLAPEVQFNVRDRTSFATTYDLPAQIDPGQYKLDQPQPDQWRLAQDISANLYNTASGIKELHLQNLIQPVDDPLRHIGAYAELIDDVIFAGYKQVVTLSESRQDGILSEAWNIIQLNPGGTILIPASPYVEWTDYYEPAGKLQEIRDHHVRVSITGQNWYKLGYKAAHVTGRFGYFNNLEGNQAYLLVRNFYNNPSALYIDEPGPQPGFRGDSIQLYNDGGTLGGFGEMEVHGQAIGGETGKSSSQDEFTLWFYTGHVDKIKRLIPHLLGIEF